MLEAISGALRLTRAERAHLILLGRGEEAPPCKSPVERVSPSLRRLIASLGTNPAYIIGRRWDYLAWNDAASALLGDLGELHRGARNHVWQTFMDPSRRTLFTDWKRTYPLLVAKFRADSAHHLGDPAFEELIGALRRSSPEFAEAWTRHEVSGPSAGRKELNHPTVGRLVFEHAVFHPSEALEQRLILYIATPEHDTGAKVASLLEPQVVAAT